MFAVDAQPVIAIEGELIIVEVQVGAADPGAVAAWLLAEARWYAEQLAGAFRNEQGEDPVRHVVNENVDDPVPDWVPVWLLGS